MVLDGKSISTYDFYAALELIKKNWESTHEKAQTTLVDSKVLPSKRAGIGVNFTAATPQESLPAN